MTDRGSCAHLKHLRSTRGSFLYPKLAAALISRKQKEEALHAGDFGGGAGENVIEGGLGEEDFACLSCGGVVPMHEMQAHLSTVCHGGSPIVVDVGRCELYCTICNDYVYDSSFDKQCIACSVSGIDSLPKSKGPPAKKIKVLDKASAGQPPAFLPPEKAERVVRLEGKKGKIPLGLRGLVNLGNTCFMNAVLQALLSSSLLRNLFLGEHHTPEMCRRTLNGETCMACEMHKLFCAAYAGLPEPFPPTDMLYTWWKHVETWMAGQLAGYKQQDAHEFFLLAIDALQQETEVPRGLHPPPGQGQGLAMPGDAVLQPLKYIFQGTARSDVTCCTCGFTSTTLDTFTALSLDVEDQFCLGVPVAAADEAMAAEMLGGMADKGGGGGKSSNSAAAARENVNSSRRGPSVLGALQRYTRAEKLQATDRFVCPHCKSKQESVKQMSLSHLPPILCLHLKRFEHNAQRNVSKKLSAHVRFPIKQLDLTPFLSSSILQGKHRYRMRLPAPKRHTRPHFQLFAVVVHSGNFEGGHYITYVRSEKLWYRCDDAWLSVVSVAEVKRAQAYMLFYSAAEVAYSAT